MNNVGQSKIIVILTGVLLAALLAAGAVIFLLPKEGSALNLSSLTDFFANLTSPTPSSDAPGSTPQPAIADFDTTPLNRKSYTDLNTTLIDNGLLPVRPDPGAGKANPFL